MDRPQPPRRLGRDRAVCPAPPFGTIPLAANARNLAVHLFQGDADPLVSAEGTRQWVKRLQDAGTKADFLPPVQRALTKFQDYLLFKGSPENVTAAGRFDHE